MRTGPDIPHAFVTRRSGSAQDCAGAARRGENQMKRPKRKAKGLSFGWLGGCSAEIYSRSPSGLLVLAFIACLRSRGKATARSPDASSLAGLDGAGGLYRHRHHHFSLFFFHKKRETQTNVPFPFWFAGTGLYCLLAGSRKSNGSTPVTDRHFSMFKRIQ